MYTVYAHGAEDCVPRAMYYVQRPQTSQQVYYIVYVQQRPQMKYTKESGFLLSVLRDHRFCSRGTFSVHSQRVIDSVVSELYAQLKTIDFVANVYCTFYAQVPQILQLVYYTVHRFCSECVLYCLRLDTIDSVASVLYCLQILQRMCTVLSMLRYRRFCSQCTILFIDSVASVYYTVYAQMPQILQRVHFTDHRF